MQKPTLLLFVLFAMFCTPSFAQVSQNTEIEMNAGFAQTFRTDRPFQSLIIGDPAVVDATARSDRVIVLNAKKVGISNIVALAGDHSEIVNLSVIVGRRHTIALETHRIHSFPRLHDYWSYNCIATNCIRVAAPPLASVGDKPRGYPSLIQTSSPGLAGPPTDPTTESTTAAPP